MREIGRFPLHRNRYSGKPLTIGSTPEKQKITFNRDNLKGNIQRVRNVRDKIKGFGERHPNLADPSWMLQDDTFNTKRRKRK